ncbi:MAG: 50S ribosomal protein L4 [gamma proteobacterium endosymbiont of Trioza apicalis]
MELLLRDSKSKIIVSKHIFDYKFNQALIHQIVVSYSLFSRQGTHSQKTRSEVSGSNKKPWRQKGTGRARVGSIRSPIWRSGGIIFASKPKKYIQKINKKMYRGALKSIFSELIRKNRLIIFKNFNISKPKTSLLLKKINNLMLKEVLIIIDEFNENLFLASRNLYKINVLNVNNINPISLINFNNIIITISALKKIEDMLNDS